MNQYVLQDKTFYLLFPVLGVVFGDIGTSPLYALKSCFNIGQIQVNELNVIGLISLFVWCLVCVVSLKYVALVLKMNHQGEGGILALSTLVASQRKHRRLAIFLGILGVSFFFGDGIITPAISVLSAVEGISVINNHFTAYVFPITFIILTFLFFIQKFGTAKIGYFFGPIMTIWFAVLFILGIYSIYQMPSILKSLNPYYAIYFILNHGWVGLTIIGGVILVVTGVEALYADLGHFGRKPIELSWNIFVLPSLVCNYLGQGALLLKSPEAIQNPFYLMAPEWGVHSLIILATLATIIASQAILTGIFSIAYHSILLNYFPRLKVLHTSEEFKGRIYIPAINIVMYIFTIGAIIKFGSSENLSAAYGLGVACIMLITSILIFILKYKDIKWSKLKLFCLLMPLLLLDIIFVSSNLIKFLDGAWYILVIASIAYYCIYVWRKGSKALENQKFISDYSLVEFLENHLKEFDYRTSGTALFLCREPFKVPTALAINLQHNKYIHEKAFFIAFVNVDAPYYNDIDSFSINNIGHNCYQVIARSGFMQKPNIHKLLNWLKQKHFLDKDEQISIFLSRGVPVKTKSKVLNGMSENIYCFLSLIAQNATDFYHIPHHKVVELGVRYKI